jgi:hypothetical protein
MVVSTLLEKTRQISATDDSATDDSATDDSATDDEPKGLRSDEIFKIYREIYREWVIASRSISSQLSAYFLKIEMAQAWDHFHELMNDFYSLVISDAGTNEKDEYKNKLIHDQFIAKKNIDWDSVTSTESTKEITALWQVGNAMLDNSKEFVDRIIKKEISRLDITVSKGKI